MKISHGTRINSISEKNGYGYATANMLASLARLGYEVNPNDHTADVEIWFDQPQHWDFSKNTYKIGYHPWESTQLLKPEWREIMNGCDEIWTPSPLIADWYTRYMGITVPVYVYEHGVDPVWTPVKRTVQDKFTFLHMGGEAARKGVKEAMQAMRLAFPKNEPVELNLKIISQGWNITKLPRINVLNSKMSLEDLIQLFHDSHAYVYPSYGEGFGLTPLQAMATGMPVITLPAWAPYGEYLDPMLRVESHLTKSPWPVLHPGMMFKPDMDSLVEAMRHAYYNYDEAQAYAQSMADDLMDFYDWDFQTSKTFSALEERLKVS